MAVAPARLLAGLTDEQRAAVLAPPGPLLVLAGAGAGKTRVLTTRIAVWIATGTVDPRGVLAITFTNRAARELADRLAGLVGPEAAAGVTTGTFHAVCHRLLRANHAAIGRSAGFSIWDDGGRRRALRAALTETRVSALSVEEAGRAIGLAKARLWTPERLTVAARGDRHRALAAVWARYEQLLAESDALDFDDLIAAAVGLLETDPGVRVRCRRRWPAVCVDEYQDTNPAQARWLRLLLGPAGNLTATGDDDQAVYGFRSADVGHILAFERSHVGARTVALGANHRSSRPIVAAARALIEHNPRRHPKPLRSARGPGPPVGVEALRDEHEEAHAAARWARARLAAGLPPGEVAVLYRTRSQALVVQEAMALCDVPHRVLGSLGLFERAEVRDLHAYLQLAVNPRDRVAFERAARAPRRGLGPSALAAITAHADGGDLVAVCTNADAVAGLRARQRAAAGALAPTLAQIAERSRDRDVAATVLFALERSGLLDALRGSADERAPERLETLRDVVRWARAYQRATTDPTLAGYLAQTSLGDDVDGDGGRVTLATVHAAKGLEWRAVRLVGLQEGVFPHARALLDGPLDEERRLAYVAFTRAREQLVVSWAAQRRGQPQLRSRFITEAGLATRTLAA